MSENSKRLVIDTSVLRAASGVETSSEDAASCGHFLEAVLEICHRVVRSEAIKSEWKKGRPERPWNLYMSRYSRKWFLLMTSKRKVHKIEEETYSQDVRDNLEESQDTDSQKKAVLKDAFLVEAALKTDLIIVSLDEKLKELLKRSIPAISDVKTILWVNPTRKTVSLLEWLEAGAPFEKKWTVGYD